MVLSLAFPLEFLSRVHKITFQVNALNQSKLNIMPVNLRLYKVTALPIKDFYDILTILILCLPVLCSLNIWQMDSKISLLSHIKL